MRPSIYLDRNYFEVSAVSQFASTVTRFTAQVLGDDLATKYLGYWTDNGAFYYYNPLAGSSYEETLVAVADGLAAAGVPVRYLNLDSWWYSKGLDLGTKEWAPIPGLFPSGGQCSCTVVFPSRGGHQKH
jgi:hypothetical protein